MNLCKGGVKHAALDGFVRYPPLSNRRNFASIRLAKSVFENAQPACSADLGDWGLPQQAKLRPGSPRTLLAKTVTQFRYLK